MPCRSANSARVQAALGIGLRLAGCSMTGKDVARYRDCTTFALILFHREGRGGSQVLGSQKYFAATPAFFPWRSPWAQLAYLGGRSRRALRVVRMNFSSGHFSTFPHLSVG